MTDPESTCRTLHTPIHIISLGAGVQSSTMALMAARGLIAPMPQCAIFADTQAEPQSVYTWLDWLEQNRLGVVPCWKDNPDGMLVFHGWIVVAAENSEQQIGIELNRPTLREAVQAAYSTLSGYVALGSESSL